MSRKTFIATTATVIVLIFMLGQIVQVVKANPWIIFKEATPIPGTIPPTIAILSPQNNTIYNSNTVLLSFNTSKPQPPLSVDAGLFSIIYSLDYINYSNPYGESSRNLYYCTSYNSASPPGIPVFSYSDNLTLPEGNHTITVYSGGVVLPGNLTISSVWSNSTVFFAIDTSTPSPRPTPITTHSPLPTPSPSPTVAPSQTLAPTNSTTQQPAIEPTQTPDRPKIRDFAPVLIPVSMIFLAIIAVGLLLYFSKRRGKKQ